MNLGDTFKVISLIYIVNTAIAIPEKRFNTSKSTVDLPLTSTIINGFAAGESRPFFVRVIKVVEDETNLCGGAVIDAFWVVTAAQCVPTGEDATRSVVVQFGNFAAKPGVGDFATVAVAIVHPNFEMEPDGDRAPKYDIGLLKTNRKIPEFRIIPLCQERYFFTCSLLASCGLGSTKWQSNQIAQSIHEALFVELVRSYLFKCSPEHICTRGLRGEESLLDRGDIGSPLWRFGVWALEVECLYGVASYHETFRTGRGHHIDHLEPNFFTSVPHVVQWIEECMSNH